MPPLIYETVAWLRLYSCLPFPALPGESETAVAADPRQQAPHAAPIAGALIGAAGGLLLLLASSLGASDFVAAALALMLLVVLTCGRSERALAAAAEKLGIEAPARVMGYGVIAIVLAVLTRVGAIEALTFHGAWKAALALVAAAALARAAVLAFTILRPAGGEAEMADKAAVAESDKSALQWLAIFGLGIAIVAVLPTYGIGATIAGLAAAAGAVGLVSAFVPRQADEPTGAAELVAEIAFLFAVLAFASNSSSV